MTDKETVLLKYPKAYILPTLNRNPDYAFAVALGNCFVFYVYGATESEAWAAANRFIKDRKDYNNSQLSDLG